MAGVSLAGPGVVLAGASSGVGPELALVLAGRGARLVPAARRTERLEALAAEVVRRGRERPEAIATALSHRGAAERLAEEAQAALGEIDVLINNAGGGVG